MFFTQNSVIQLCWVFFFLLPVVRSQIEPPFTKPSTLRHAIPSPESTTAPGSLRAAIPTPTIPTLSLSSLRATIPSSDPATVTLSNTISALPSTPTLVLTSTITISTTLLLPPTSPPFPNEESLPSITNDAAPETAPQESATPVPQSTGTPMGMGVGIAFSVFTIAGVAGIYLWRRHTNLRKQFKNRAVLNDNDENKPPPPPPPHTRPSSILSKVLQLRRASKQRVSRDIKTDPEWSIESVEKVSISKNLRAHSVVSRSNSRGSEKGVIPIMIANTPPPLSLVSTPRSCDANRSTDRATQPCVQAPRAKPLIGPTDSDIELGYSILQHETGIVKEKRHNWDWWVVRRKGAWGGEASSSQGGNAVVSK
ncbi:hypothetical protein GQ44DRAFT_828398 [Phaeosphaeriaceae sp. PMI808]|nr:hypothetical protein GQ44DRAFT_828398 [Phaeosphaeriaceae sp. PMI808]